MQDSKTGGKTVMRPYLELGLMMALLNRGLHKMMVEWGRGKSKGSGVWLSDGGGGGGGGGGVEHNRLAEGDG